MASLIVPRGCFLRFLMPGLECVPYCKTAEKRTVVAQFRVRLGVRFRINVGYVFEACLIIICTFFVNSVIKQHTFSRMKVLTSPKIIFSTGFTKKFENQCKSRRVRFTSVLQCYLIQTIFTKHIKLQTSRFLVFCLSMPGSFPRVLYCKIRVV